MYFESSNPSNKFQEQDKPNDGIKTFSLLKAIENMQVDEVKKILESDTLNRNSKSAGLVKALQHYKPNTEMLIIINYLLQHNADPNFVVSFQNIAKAQKVSVLMYATKLGDFELVQTIMNYSPDVNMKDKYDRNALFYAIESGDHYDIVNLLIKANININDIAKGNSALSIAVSKNHKFTIRLLLDNGANPNFQYETGDSLLHMAINNGDLELVKMLVDKHVDIHISNKDGLTPIDLALKKSQTEMYQILVEEYNKSDIEHKKDEEVVQERRRKSKKLEQLEQKKKIKSSAALEIPFVFNRNNQNATQLRSFIKLQSTPVFHIDLSDENMQNTAITTHRIEQLTQQMSDYERKFKIQDEQFKYLKEENVKLKNENVNLMDLLSQKDKHNQEMKNKEEQYIHKISDLQRILEDKSITLNSFVEQYNKLEKELERHGDKISSIREFSRKEILEKKFSTTKYEDKYIMKSLQKDILDFQEYTKDQIRKNRIMLDELIRLVQSTVNECIPEYEVKLYGSHATNLCLPSSDLDIVLINKRTGYSNDYRVLQQLYLALIEKTWKKSIKFIDTALIPIIKINAADEFNSMQMDISLQDGKHYGIKCVELVKSFMTEYEALEPLIFALKNLLKNANLNDPYTGGLSSYGLILMVVSYLQSQLESNKSIKIAEGNLGRLFIEFLCYYGIIFDHTKYVIYTYPPNDIYGDKDQNNLFLNMQSGHELIVVDPLNKQNNVARSTYQFMNIKMAFMIGFVVSREECECGCHFNKSCEEYSITNTEHCILKRIFNSVKRFNANVNN